MYVTNCNRTKVQKSGIDWFFCDINHRLRSFPLQMLSSLKISDFKSSIFRREKIVETSDYKVRVARWFVFRPNSRNLGKF
jgi:hypothetical protein